MFSIIVVNWNGEKYLKGFFNSLVEQNYKNFEVYFVDNGSSDYSLDIVKEYSRYLEIIVIKLSENLGFAEANNIGIDVALKRNADYIITLNNDMELANDCLHKVHLAVLNSKPNDVYQILIVNYYDRKLIDAAGIKFDKFLFASQIGHGKKINSFDFKRTKLQGVCAGAAVYSKNSLLRIKESDGYYFDPSFFAYYEDVDLSLRLKKMSNNFLLLNDAIVYHHHSGTGIQNSPFKTFYLTRNLFLYSKKYNLKYYYFLLKGIYLSLTIAKATKFIIKRDYKNVNAIYKALKSI
ncbi:glycosyltransferase family 2 protein [Desemzia sp. RIT804]|uniref:glycosyltransferase family 2 protein n=1 Tax=Desemzia sp. RIT 804 TaxID=2810209 RepID=UPI00194FF76C|nr:glycosyltransferase family 2 protein [Desemzia sp. RIT 804]MBM6615366.1 glycosyltransferase family 2 protein [Desemzia sp. RIT 804]